MHGGGGGMKLDPLAGKREEINNGNGTSLFWPDPHKKPCPVEIGQTFRLRSGGIEITRRERVKEKGMMFWRADFIRIGRPTKPYLLKRGGAYTHDPDLAMRSQDDWQSAPTLDTVNPDDRSEAHRALGQPPEPEGPAPQEVASLQKTMEARLLHRDQQRQERMEQNARTDARRVAARMRDVAVMAARHGVDPTLFFVALENEITTQAQRLRNAA